jgi:DNA repair protein RadC
MKQYFSEITINYKQVTPFTELPSISQSIDAVNIFRSYWSEKISYREECHVLLLNRANKVIGFSKISEGGIAGTVVDLRMVFQAALKSNASAVIIAHNHPSGNLKPSDADKKLTQKLIQSGKILDIPVLDHLILTEFDFYSFADNGDM